MIVYAAAYGHITPADDAVEAAGVIEQLRDDTDAGTVSANAALTTDDTLWNAIAATPVRWSGARVEIEGLPVLLGRTGPVTVESVLDVAPRSAGFHVSDPRWALPADIVWGNRAIDIYLLFASNPRLFREVRAFSGLTLQKSNKSDVPVETDIVCSDLSGDLAGVPVCYSLPAFAGMRRGEIVRDIIRQNPTLGLSDDQVFVPVGKVVHKKVLLNNASLLPFIAEFGAVENWFPYIDNDGNLIVKKIELKAEPDWELDGSKGGFDADSFQETAPSRPPRRWYITADQPVQTVGPDGRPTRSTSLQTQEEIAFYNPECLKVRPSGGDSHLQADGSYRILEDQQLMVVGRIKTETTTEAGDEIRKVVTTERFYNPAAYDPNYDSFPAGTSYDGAYGDKSFHRDESESLMEVSREMTETFRDLNGTVLQKVTTTLGWKAPQCAMHFDDPTNRAQITNAADQYVYAGGTFRTLQVEDYRVVGIVATDYLYGADGTQYAQVDTAFEWTAPEASCDVEQLDGTAIAGVGGGTGDRLSGFPEELGPGWRPSISGPYRPTTDEELADRWVFAAAFSNIPADATDITLDQVIVRIVNTTGGNPEPGGAFSLPWNGLIPVGQDLHWPSATLFKVYALMAGAVKPAGYLHCYIRVQAQVVGGTSAGERLSAKLIFDPFVV